MATIQFANGIKVDFEGTPTEKDIEEVAQKLIADGILQNENAGVRTADKPDLLTKTSKILNTIFGGGKIGEAIGTQIAKATVPKEQRQFVSPAPPASEVLGDIGSTALSLATLGGAGTVGGLGARILKTAALGAGMTGSKSLAEGKTLTESAKGAAIGGAISGAIPLAGAGLRAIGRQIELLPSRFVSSALSRSKAEVLQDIAKDNVDDFSKYVVQNKGALKSANTHLKESIDSIDGLSAKISEKLVSATRQTGGKVTIGTNNFLDEITQIPEAQGALLKRNDIREIVTRLAPQTKKLLSKESLTLAEANNLRQLVDKTLGDRAFLGAQLSSDKIILKKFADNLRETVKTKAPSVVRGLFSELSNEIRFRDGMLDRIAKKQGNQVLSFGDFIGGGLGGIFGGGVPGAVAGVATRRAIESVPFKITMAKFIDATTKIEPVIEQLTPAQRTAILSFLSEIFSQQATPEETQPISGQ